MKIGALPLDTLRDLLQRQGVAWHAGPFTVRLQAHSPEFVIPFHTLYAEHRWIDPAEGTWLDYHLALMPGRGVRRWWRPQVHFEMDGPADLAPFPRDHALPLFEWGFNYAIASRANHFLLLHAAVVARQDRALLLPGLPGSGKSTLCAGLVLRGWRLLSDEFGLLRPATGMLHPLPRPIGLKNDSIEVIRAFDAAAVLGPTFPKTRKGRVAHLRPPASSVQEENQPARPVWVVCPRFQAGASLVLEPLSLDRGFLRLAGNSFNYELLGEIGFSAVAALTRHCSFYELRFGRLDEAIACLDALANGEWSE